MRLSENLTGKPCFPTEVTATTTTKKNLLLDSKLINKMFAFENLHQAKNDSNYLKSPL